MSDEELTQAMTDAVIFGTGVMQDGKRIDPQSFFVQPASDPVCEHCGMDPAALTAVSAPDLETCGKCMGSGYGGHPDSGALCSDCNGTGGVFALVIGVTALPWALGEKG